MAKIRESSVFTVSQKDSHEYLKISALQRHPSIPAYFWQNEGFDSWCWKEKLAES